jgi:hypothetical protein
VAIFRTTKPCIKISLTNGTYNINSTFEYLSFIKDYLIFLPFLKGYPTIPYNRNMKNIHEYQKVTKILELQWYYLY